MSEQKCPTCQGVPVDAVAGCFGCMDCDFHGTLAGYEEMQKAIAEANAAETAYMQRGVCERCGACSSREADRLCRPEQGPDDEYHCPGERLWRDA